MYDTKADSIKVVNRIEGYIICQQQFRRHLNENERNKGSQYIQINPVISGATIIEKRSKDSSQTPPSEVHYCQLCAGTVQCLFKTV